MSRLWLVLLTLQVILIYFISTKWKSIKNYVLIVKYLFKLPAPPAKNILIGNTAALHAPPEIGFKILRQWAREYFPIFHLWVVGICAACLISPEDIELVLGNNKHISKSMIYTVLENWLGTGLLTSNGDKWFLRRKILTPTFHFNILRQFVPIFNEETQIVIDGLKQQCHKPHVEINPIITQFTLKTITETAMGIKLDLTNEAHKEYKNAILKYGETIIEVVLKPYKLFKVTHFPNKYLDILHSFTRDVVKERQKNFSSIPFHVNEDEEIIYSSKKRLAMLDLLLSSKEEDKIIDDEGIREEVDTFTFEGHDTTSVALSYILMLIACHEDIQAKILEEMKEILVDIKKKPSITELQNLKYMERCIKESLRLYPSVPFISRKLGEDMVTASGYKLLKNTMTHILIYDLHRNSNVWPDPERFDPDRFLPENCQKRHPFAYLPFSAGSRNCIGQKFALLELKSVVCAVLGNFILKPVDTPETIVLVFDLVLRTKENIRIKFIPRV